MRKKESSSKKRKNVTITDVAQASGLSGATVSRVLSGYEFVKESTRSRVMKAVEELGYVANLSARSLAGGQSRMIGLLVPNLDNGYVGTITLGIDQELTTANYDSVLYTSHHSIEKESFYVHTISNGLTDGLLLVSPYTPATYINTLIEQDFPFVLVDQADATNKSSSVLATNRQGAYEATRYLVELGHTKIAIITGELCVQSAFDRLQGYKDALADSNIPLNEALIAEGQFQQQDGYEGTKKLLTHADSRPTAIFASNDLTAFGAMDAVREFGLSIPNDISIIGFDDVPQSSLVFPKLTTVRQPLEQMGRVAARMLLERIGYPNLPPQHKTLDTQLIIRDSCGPYAAQRNKSGQS